MSEIDVKECRYNWDDTEKKRKNQCSIIYGNCKDFKDCYYRQLQQQKQENKRLRQELQGIKELLGSCESDLLELKAENEKLKDKINENNICYNELLKLKEFFYNKAKTFYYCIDEIEHICNDSYCDNTVCANCGYNAIDCDLVRRKAVLQKIKEVKGNE